MILRPHPKSAKMATSIQKPKIIKTRGFFLWNFNPLQAGISESLIRQVGGKWPTRDNQLYRLYFYHLNNRKIPRDSRDTRPNNYRVGYKRIYVLLTRTRYWIFKLEFGWTETKYGILKKEFGWTKTENRIFLFEFGWMEIKL